MGVGFMMITLPCHTLRQVRVESRQTATRAFTLVEIMIVVTIVGLLVGIAVPNFIKHRNSVRVKACMDNLRVLDSAKAQWGIEERKSATIVPTATELSTYLRDARLPECPANGTYRLRSLAKTPVCSLSPEGHTLRNLNADDDPAVD